MDCQKAKFGDSRGVGATGGQNQVSVAVKASVGRQTLILDGFPTTAEVKMLGPNSGTANRYALAAIRSRIQDWVKIEAGIQMIAPMPPPVLVTLRYVFADSRHRDADNFAAIGKPVIDGLVRSGILAGDNHARLHERIEFAKEAGARRLEIVLEPLATAGPSARGGEGEATTDAER